MTRPQYNEHSQNFGNRLAHSPRQSPADVQRQLATFREDTLKPVRFGYVPIADALLPLVELDVKNRVELYDLPRVHATEGESDQWNAWSVAATPSAVLLRLDLTLRKPVRAHLAILLDVASCADWLASVSRAGLLCTTFRHHETTREALTSGVGWTVGDDEGVLAAALVLARLRAAMKAAR